MKRNARIQFVMNLYLYLGRMNVISLACFRDSVAREALGNAIYHINLGNCRDCRNIIANNLRYRWLSPWLVFHIWIVLYMYSRKRTHTRVLNKIWLNTQILLCSNIFFLRNWKTFMSFMYFRYRRWISVYIEMSLLL